MKTKPLIVLVAAALAAPLAAADNAPDLEPLPSSPVVTNVMEGFPPKPEDLITLSNMRTDRFPYNRWSFLHMRQFYPTAKIRPAHGAAISELKRNPYPVASISFVRKDGKEVSVLHWLRGSYTDGFIVLHNGQIAYEYYAAHMDPWQPHLLMSVSKSLLGLVASQLIAEGRLDPSALITKYVPQLQDSGWASATVQQTLDMTASIDFTEQYTDLKHSDIQHYGIATGLMLPPDNYNGPTNLYDFLATLGPGKEKQEGHFVYRTVNPEVMGWVVQKVMGKPLSDILTDLIWQPMGAKFGAYVILDPHGMALSGGQLNVALRDLARFGQMVLQHGHYNGHQILNPKAYEMLFTHDYPVKVPGPGTYRYHNYWWLTNNSDHAIEGIGAYGQFLYVNPTENVVIVKFSSTKMPNAHFNRRMRAVSAIVAALDQASQS